MALEVPNHLKDRSPEFLHHVLESTYLRPPQYGKGDNSMTCSERPYGLKICHGPERDGVRYGTFLTTNLLCRWLGVNCTSGQFYSKMFTVGQTPYELRSGIFSLGKMAGSYGVAVVNADDTRFVGQSVDVWEKYRGDAMILGAALAGACVPVVEPFTRTVYQSTGHGSNPNARSEVVTSAILTESGTRTYCKNMDVPQPRPVPVVIPQLANWWTTIQDSMAAYMHPMRGNPLSGEMALAQ